jgi:hypothetical protein
MAQRAFLREMRRIPAAFEDRQQKPIVHRALAKPRQSQL